MISGKTLFCILVLGATAALARDVNQPVSRGNLEVGSGYSYSRITGYFDSTGTYRRYPNGFAPAGHGIPLRLRYGFGGGFDARVEWERVYANADAGNATGMTQPRFVARYIRPLAGLVLTYTPAWATEDFDRPGLRQDLEVAGLLRKRTENFRFSALAGYGWNEGKASRFRLSFTPTYLWGQGVEMYATTEYTRGIELDAYLISINPGVRIDISRSLYVDAGFPHSLSGRSAAGGVAPVGWSARAIAYWTPGR